MLRIAVLGGLSLEQDERPLSPPVGRPARLLLGWLALHSGAHSRAAVAAELWPDVLDESARGSLRVALVDLRRALGETAERALMATRDQIGLIDSPELEVDARRFTALVQAGMTREALVLWRGELLEGLDAGDWLVELRDEYRDRRSRAIAALADHAAARGELDEAVRLARERVSLEPFSEEATRELMRRLTAVGDRAAALVAYDRLAERLRSELRTAPSAPTRALTEAIREGEGEQAEAPAGAATESWLPATVDASPRRSAFVGREHELELLLSCVRERRRLALISGDPGAGKTRLMFELGRLASSEGVSVLFGRCQQEPLAPYEPFVQALREHVAMGGAGAVASLTGEELARLLPELRVAQPPQPAGEVADAARLRLFEGVRATLEHAARRRPVMLLLDDLHWADSSTLLLLAYLVRVQTSGAVTIVGAYRPSELGSERSSRRAAIRPTLLTTRLPPAASTAPNGRSGPPAWRPRRLSRVSPMKKPPATTSVPSRPLSRIRARGAPSGASCCWQSARLRLAPATRPPRTRYSRPSAKRGASMTPSSSHAPCSAVAVWASRSWDLTRHVPTRSRARSSCSATAQPPCARASWPG